MSSIYPILGNQPIDQWKVMELKEELKRRKLTTKGLKDDLIERLDDAIRTDMENVKKVVDNDINCGSQRAVVAKGAQTIAVAAETANYVATHCGNKNNKPDNVAVQVDINDSVETFEQEKVEEHGLLGAPDSARVEGEQLVHTAAFESSTKVPEIVVSVVAFSGQDMENTETQKENRNSKPQLDNEKPRLANEDLKPQLENEDWKPWLENEDSNPKHENEDSMPQLENEDSKLQLENEGLKLPSWDVMLNSSTPDNQVSEVSPILGSQVKSDSISTDSVSINEKIELRDNVITDHVELELDIVKPEMVEPSSSSVVPVGGESHPMDVGDPHENKSSNGGKDDNNATNAEISKKIDSTDVGFSEKLNLDRSSGDDSMEEDILETKPIDWKNNSEKVEKESDKRGENENCPAASAEKRKLNDQVANNEPIKRQRRWNSDGLKVPEPHSTNSTPTTTPKDTFRSTDLKRSFSRSDSTNSDNTPKERVVPPSQKAPTNSLRIDRFLRPFTLKAVQELLDKTGSVASFWMDHIKTHCYVTYSSVEEAIETRNAMYNLQWPPKGGRLLLAEFVDPQEVKMWVEAPQTLAAPASAGPTIPPAPPTPKPQPSHQHKLQLLPPPPLPPPPPLSNLLQSREQVHLPPPPPLPEKLDPPVVTLDDLFRKTKAMPRIYYLPLSEEQVAEKLASQGKNTKQ
ncbi:apoptotic chromatin condensation inducer in the nucleus-like [Juglans microcarpa x Juglans regia]|uniref:apoptotic chromatin condensation inducer in the nucleus-like n=1 Tax=Juglans microcarpa x Juglans regia TaxID=2249226 RepID=UPI001B7F4358|nr:apoptotic chromatin condensation inducer in the nucleus-like [Juglans microcarpa x Juglans regia]